MEKLMTTITQNRTNNVIIKTIIILKSFHSIFNISSIKDIQIITSPWCVYNHHTICFVHKEKSMTTSDHYYQLCPLEDHNHHIRSLLQVFFPMRAHNHHISSLLPVVSTGRPQLPLLITATSCIHWENTITTSEHCYQFFSTESPQSPHLITTTSCVHWETTITTSDHCYQVFVHWQTTLTTYDHCYQLCSLGAHNHHIWSLLPVVSTGRLQLPLLITTTSCVHLETTISTSDHYYQLCPLGIHIHHIW